jgi:cytochrome P450
MRPPAEQWCFPAERGDPAHPPRQYAAGSTGNLRKVPLSYGGTAWLVTEYDDARRVLSDPSFSSDSTRRGYPVFPLAPREKIPGHFISMDAPEHTRLRHSVAAPFRPGTLSAIEPYLAGVAERLITAARDHAAEFDLVSQVAVPLHGDVLAELLGVPAGGHHLFQECARQMQRHDSSAVRRAAAAGRIGRYVGELLSASTQLRAGTILNLLRDSTATGENSQDEAVAMASLSIVAGFETTVGSLALTVLSLLRDRRQWDMVRESPGRWAAAAVDEGLRFWSVAQHGVARVATRDVALSGQKITAGEAVVVHLPSANRDPRVYSQADAFDITRNARNHLSFGHGPHHCLGAPLARMEMTAAIAALASITPGLRLSRPSDLSYLHHMLVFGVAELPLTAHGPLTPEGDN